MLCVEEVFREINTTENRVLPPKSKMYSFNFDFFRETNQINEARQTIPFNFQASTMRILDTYYRVGAPGAVAIPISDACRSATLTFRASSAYIFDRARREMLQLMGIEVEPLVSVSSFSSSCIISQCDVLCCVTLRQAVGRAMIWKYSSN